ncbi:MAG: adenylate kinase [Gammaproteobacteria bacterium]|jgi:adenylate kinase|nr:adenylate kinase [Gammaproteobacteria bacterium]
MRIVLLGPPGGGKGTQAAILKQQWNIPHVSTGELLRAACREQTPLGQKVQAVMDAGELVSDDLMLDLLEQRFAASDVDKGFILDGYPRNLAQADALDKLLRRIDQPLDLALLIEVDQQHILDRIEQRAREEGRSDDTAEVVRNRLQVYLEHTAPVAEYYAADGRLIRVLGEGEIDAITQRILAAMQAADCMH